MRRLSESEIKRVERLSDTAASPILEKDMVNNPQHYKCGTFEVIDEMLLVFGPARTYDFCIMNAWKYRSRAPYKNDMKQDMDKADRYIQMAYQILENNPKMGHVGLIKLTKEE